MDVEDDSYQTLTFFLQYGNGLVNGGQHNYQWGGYKRHFGVRWWRRNWGAKHNIPGFIGGTWSHINWQHQGHKWVQWCE